MGVIRPAVTCQRDGVGGACIGGVALGDDLHVPPCSDARQVAQHLKVPHTLIPITIVCRQLPAWTCALC